MRVIAGLWRGRRIASPRGTDTRPTADRVREAIFSAVVSRLGTLEGLAALDLYAGSGALGIEALSRGARHVTFVDRDRRAIEQVRANLSALGADPGTYTVISADAGRFAAASQVNGGVALLFADPPYRIDAAEVSHILEVLAGSGAIAPGALIVYEHARDGAMTWPEGFVGEHARSYGDTGVSLARYEGGL